MKKTLLICVAVAALCGTLSAADANAEIAREVLTLERQALDGWLNGDPDPMLAISAPEITYFHVMTDRRVEGLQAVKAIYESYRGTPLFDSYEIVDPKVQAIGDIAVLTYILVRRNGSATSRWNATQVYQRRKEGWRVIHTHWSMTKPRFATPPQ